MDFEFSPPFTVGRFMQSNERKRMITGPFGSAKTTGCVFEVLRRMAAHPHYTDGYRHFRAAVVRPTMPELRTTTLPSWHRWTQGLGDYRTTERVHYINIDDIKAEILFIALDDAADIRKLLGIEYNLLWVNELREADPEVVNAAIGRLGRWYPMPHAWDGVIGDTNPPLMDTYWCHVMMGFDPETGEEWEDDEKRASGSWTVFRQPSGLSKHAENLENLPGGSKENPAGGRQYYLNMLGNNENYVRMYVHGLPGRSLSGTPVHPEFLDTDHVSQESLKFDRARDVCLSFDFGRTPACTVSQEDVGGRILFLAEAVTPEKTTQSVETFMRRQVLPMLRQRFKDCSFVVTGDPTGMHGGQAKEISPFKVILDELGLTHRSLWVPDSNDLQPRKEALDKFLTMRRGVLIDKSCRTLIRGLGGKFNYPKTKGRVSISETPLKNHESHVSEASQYAAMQHLRGTAKADKQKSASNWLAKVQKQAGYHQR